VLCTVHVYYMHVMTLLDSSVTHAYIRHWVGLCVDQSSKADADQYARLFRLGAGSPPYPATQNSPLEPAAQNQDIPLIK
jgi:hypothetical protein